MRHILLLLVFIVLSFSTFAQCPTQLTVTAGNTGTWVNTSSGTATVRITAVGGGGGKNTGNNCTGATTFTGGGGATIQGEFTVAPGASIFLIAGAAGSNSLCAGSGGGGSGAINCGNPSNCGTGTILLIAGGGGGTSGFVNGQGGRATSSTGSGGGNNSRGGGGGGGLNAAGANGTGATLNAGGGGQVSKTAISSGGTAGSSNGVPGTTGGNGMGGGGGTANGYAAGGGGHTGGNGEDDNGGNNGGFSINTGANQVNTAGTNGGGANAGSVSLTCLSVLPVELISFKATPQYQSVKLNWETANEINNMGFHVERQNTIDGKWDELSFIKSQGSSSVYEFIDNNPLIQNYYRLKQVDFDGGFEYSKIIAATLDSKGIMSVFPNPSKGLFNITGLKDLESEQYKLMNSIGQTVSVTVQNNGQLDLSECPSGVYYLRVISTGNVTKLVKE